MDLPTCPDCGQSVLDDDAQDCPFCGASMTGAPAKKTTAKPTKKAEGKKPSAKKKSEKAKSSGDDPFEMDTTAAQRAIPLQRKPSKGRMFRVSCPMCETNGFTSKKAAGRDVRCANPECLVPIFTAPKPEEPEKATPESEAASQETDNGGSAGMKIGVAVVAIALIGGAVWYFGFRSDSGQPSGQQDAGYGPQPAIDPTTPDTPIVDPGDEKKDGTDTPVETGPSLAELRSQSLEQMVVAARQRNNNRSKPLCRRLAAEAYALLGDFTEAANQRQQLTKVGESLPYYQVPPLCAQAWSQFEKGDTKAAVETADAALKASQRLPKFGQTAAKATVNLAAVLVAAGREADANGLIKRQNDSGPFAQLAGLLTDTYNRRSFNIEGAIEIRPAVAWNSPQRAGAIQVLVAHGQDDKALEWAASTTDIPARTEALAAWAAATARAGNGRAALASIEAKASQLPAASKARILAQLALGHIAASDQAGAEKAVTAAQAAAASVKKPAALTMPNMAQMYEYELPNAAPMQAGILAHSEIAHVQALLGKTADATESLAAVCDIARAIAPSPIGTQECFDEIERGGVSTTNSRLQNALGISTTDKLDIARRRYTRQCQKVNEAAQARFNLQETILTQAIEWGLLDAVWKEIGEQAKADAASNEEEPYFDTALAVILADAYTSAGNSELAQLVQTAVESHEVRAASKDARAARVLRHKREQGTWKYANGGDPRKAAAGVNSAPVGDDAQKAWKWEWSMRVACRLVNSDKTADALAFIRALKDPVQREDVYRLAAALATKRGDGATVAEFISKNKLPFTEQVSALSGVVTGATAAIATGSQ
jgi:hypothetical protein